jgi:hypothetical protein
MAHTVAMSWIVRAARPAVLAGMVVAVALVGGADSWQPASATTSVLSRDDPRFDVLVQRQTELLDYAGAELEPPDGQPRLSAAQAWSIVGMHRAPGGRKPSVRLATFADPDFPVPSGPGHLLVPVSKRALVWVVVVPDVPVVDFVNFGPGPLPAGVERPAPRQWRCPVYAPVDAISGQSLGWWHHCSPG